MTKLNEDVTVVFVPVGMSEEALDILVSDLPYPVYQTVCEDFFMGGEYIIFSKYPTPEGFKWVSDWLSSILQQYPHTDIQWLGEPVEDMNVLEYINLGQ